jgi:hypothetical protein
MPVMNGIGDEWYVSHDAGASNHWYFRHNDGSGLEFRLRVGASNIIDVAGGGEITDTDWHHVALIKTGNNYGCYLDGIQVNHINTATTGNITGTLYIGIDPNAAGYMNGNMEQIRLSQSNIFGVTPTQQIQTPSYCCLSIQTLKTHPIMTGRYRQLQMCLQVRLVGLEIPIHSMARLIT